MWIGWTGAWWLIDWLIDWQESTWGAPRRETSASSKQTDGSRTSSTGSSTNPYELLALKLYGWCLKQQSKATVMLPKRHYPTGHRHWIKEETTGATIENTSWPTWSKLVESFQQPRSNIWLLYHGIWRLGFFTAFYAAISSKSPKQVASKNPTVELASIEQQITDMCAKQLPCDQFVRLNDKLKNWCI